MSRTTTLVLAAFLAGVGRPQPAALAQTATLVVGGDIEWALEMRRPGIHFQSSDSGWRPIPYLLTPERRAELRRRDSAQLAGLETHYNSSIRYDLSFTSAGEQARYPFRRIAPILRAADVAFVNLETAISDRARHASDVALRTPASFVDGVKWAGVDVVSIANNHAMDAEGEGLLDGIATLTRAGVGFVGGGRDLAEARRPFRITTNGIRIAFLGYTQLINVGVEGFALPRRSGLAPMDPFLIKEDIRRVRDSVDHVILSFHWGGSTETKPHPEARKLAHEMLDAGADIILGHHPPVLEGVEVYKGKVIFYSLSKLIFGHNHAEWGDNYLARLTLAKDRVRQVEIIPVAGRGKDLAQPYPLDGGRARALLEEFGRLSAEFGTPVEVRGNVGVIRP